MNSLTVLRETLYKLRKKEVTSLLIYLKSYRKESNETAMKSIQLVTLLLKDRVSSSVQIQKKLYVKSNYHAYKKLISRLLEKIYEVLTFDVNLSSQEYSKSNQMIFDLRKKILQSEILTVRGMNYENEKLLNKIIQKAKEYEIYDSLLAALYSKQRYLSFRYDISANNNIKNEIDLFETIRYKAIHARIIFNNITHKINFSNSPDDYKNELIKSLKLLSSDFDLTKSATIGYYYYFLEAERLQIAEMFEASQQILFKIKDLLEKSSAVFTANRMGTVLLNISITDLMVFKFEKSLETLEDSIKYFSDPKVNDLFAKEFIFHCLYYSGKIDRAEKLIE
jgi:hypothetical protein